MDDGILDIVVISLAEVTPGVRIDHNTPVDINGLLIVMIDAQQVNLGEAHIGRQLHAGEGHRATAVELMRDIRGKRKGIALLLVIIQMEIACIFDGYVVPPFELDGNEPGFCLYGVDFHLLALRVEFVLAVIVGRAPGRLIKQPVNPVYAESDLSVFLQKNQILCPQTGSIGDDKAVLAEVDVFELLQPSSLCALFISSGNTGFVMRLSLSNRQLHVFHSALFGLLPDALCAL